MKTRCCLNIFLLLMLIVVAACQNITVTEFVGSLTPGSNDGVGIAASYSNLRLIHYNKYNHKFYTFNDKFLRTVTLDGTVTTVSWTGLPRQFTSPACIAVNSRGDVFIADMDMHVMKKIVPSGEISTFVGNGNGTIMDGIGMNASLLFPSCAVVDSQDNIFVIDSCRLRKISPNGTVQTITVSTSCSIFPADGSLANATFSYSRQYCVIDSKDNIYFTDRCIIRRASLTEGTITTLAGSNIFCSPSQDGFGQNARFTILQGLAINKNDTMYAIEQNAVRIIEPSVLALDDSRTLTGVALDANGVVYVADYSRILRITRIAPAPKPTFSPYRPTSSPKPMVSLQPKNSTNAGHSAAHDRFETILSILLFVLLIMQ